MLEPMEDRVLLSTVYDAAAQFSALTNPAGPWTYGYESALGAADTFTVDAFPFNLTTGLDSWGANVADSGNPSVTHNPGADPVTFFTITVGPGELMLHPGPDGELSMVRFTAPAAGLYDLRAAFASRDAFPGGTDVHVLVNNVSIFDAEVVTNSPSFDVSALPLAFPRNRYWVAALAPTVKLQE